MADQYDVLVIGGGIHGVGVAQAAAAKGYSVLLLEQTGLASGSSSRSSKLIHGGLRYLESFQFSLVRESLQERSILLQIAPDLVRLRRFLIPVYPDTSRRPWQLRVGLGLYAMLAGDDRGREHGILPRRYWDQLDGLRTDRLQAVFYYHDAQTDDARLTRAVMYSAAQLGAEFLRPAEFIAADVRKSVCTIRYHHNGSDQECQARVVVNAAGPWVNDVLARMNPQPEKRSVDLIQGTHLILERYISDDCFYLEVPSDRRAVFLMPWNGQTLLGTTETLYQGDPSAVRPTPGDTDYLMDVVYRYFPDESPKVMDSFAGLRVLPGAQGAAFRRSRETFFSVDNKQRPCVVSIYGGKLTGYRAAAEKVMSILRGSLPVRDQMADTANLMLHPERGV